MTVTFGVDEPGEAGVASRNIGVRKHLNMNPREFVQSLADPDISRRMLGADASNNQARLAEIAGWLWAEGQWPTWGEGGKGFILRAKTAAEEDRFEAWLAALPPMKEK
jgi:hypothetical protein